MACTYDHHKVNVLVAGQEFDILQRVPVDEDEVRIVSRQNLAKLMRVHHDLPTECRS
jgi:hypothetical protein